MTEILRLMRLMTGDEKHDRRRRVDARRDPRALRPGPRRLARDRRRPAPRPLLPVQGARPDGLLRRARRPGASSPSPGWPSGPATTRRSATTRTATWCRASRSRPARSGTASRSRSAPRSACGRRGSTSRVVVLVGDAELDEGSNHEALELAAALRARRAHRRRDRQPVHVVRRPGPDRAAVRGRGLGRRDASTAATTTSSRRHCPHRSVGRPNVVVAEVEVQMNPTEPVRPDRRRPRRDRPVGRAGVRRDLRPVLRRGRGAGTPTGWSTSASASSCSSTSAPAWR